jgi:hypothetical protein
MAAFESLLKSRWHSVALLPIFLSLAKTQTWLMELEPLFCTSPESWETTS